MIYKQVDYFGDICFAGDYFGDIELKQLAMNLSFTVRAFAICKAGFPHHMIDIQIVDLLGDYTIYR